MKYKILIVEDDEIIARELETQLKNWGFESKYIRDFNRVYDEFTDYMPHLVLIDIKLPVLNGFLWCEQIRKTSIVPIIFLSSASDNMNIIMAINYGADDFIAKPFDINVLVVKIKALLRRSYDFEEERVLKYEDLTFYPEKMTIKVNGLEGELSKNESLILKILLEKLGNIVSRDDLMIALWDTEDFIDDNTLTVNVSRLRSKLKNMGVDNIIKTKKGVGYYI